MNIHEYQAKKILRDFNIPVPAGFVATNTQELETKIGQLRSDTFVIKAQVHAGGRAKAGGVKLVKSVEEAKRFVNNIIGTTLITHQTGPSGKQVRKVYIEECSSIKREHYLCLVIDQKLGRLVFIYSSEGGMDIEEVAKNFPTKIFKFDVVSSTTVDFANLYRNKLCNNFNLSLDQIEKIVDISEKMYNLFITTDASQIEINPLVETGFGTFIALDAKISFDDNALYRHPEIAQLRDYDQEIKYEIEASEYGLNYVKMDGNIGCMVNGAGLAMATMDIIKYYGAEPANFLDVGGGASKEAVTKAFQMLLSDGNVKGILVNIFGGIMRCDIVASGIVEAIRKTGIKVPLVVRLSGTNFSEGKKILEESELSVITSDELDEAAQRIVKEVKCLY